MAAVLKPIVTDTSYWRNQLKHEREILRRAYYAKPDPKRLLTQHAGLIDRIVSGLALHAALSNRCAIVAVGGYGRGLQYPCSDVDLLILTPDADIPTRDIEKFIGVLWDAGLEPGTSVRTVVECGEEALKDVTVMTGLLEARHVWGDEKLTDRLQKELRRLLDVPAFFAAKIDEQNERHGKHLDVTHNLEPNIKESPGGLRDIQTVLWLSKAAQLGNDWNALAAEGILTKAEAAKINHHTKILQDLRIRLHYLADRREDRLVFDFQTALAQQLKLESRANKQPSEALMQRYYLTAKVIWQLNTILLQNLLARISTRKKDSVKEIDDEFEIVNGYLEAKDVSIFERKPVAIFRAFLTLQRHKEAEFFSAETLRAIWRAAPKIDRDFRENPVVNNLFMQMLHEPRLTFCLRRMSRYGILGRYIPAFGRIVGQMQHDLFHVYTVDEHILMVVRNLRRFAEPRFERQHIFCSELMREFDRIEVLYIAAIFHDIAKGRGGDHSQLGMADARRFCKKLGMNEADIELIAWLVEMHLQMSATAQKQDLSDPDVIAQFTARVENERRLTALYLLTVADIRGTSPKVWNAWKAKLLEDLFRYSRRMLRGESPSRSEMIEANKAEALRSFAQYVPEVEKVEPLWSHVDESYFRRFEASEISWHARVLWQRPDPGKPIVKARLSRSGEGLQVMVFCPDQPGIFARITRFFERLQFDVAAAKIFTTNHGYALDIFQIISKGNDESRYLELIEKIETELPKRLDPDATIGAAATGRVSRQVKHFSFTPTVSVVPSRSGRFSVVTVSTADRPGVLSAIARFFFEQNVNLRDARITTLGARAEDTFVVESEALKITDNVRKFEADLVALLKT